MATTPARRTRLSSNDALPEALVLPETIDDDPDDKGQRLQRAMSLEIKKEMKKWRCSQTLIDAFYRIPPKLRIFLFLLWLLWKFIFLILFIKIAWATGTWRRGHKSAASGIQSPANSPPLRILYIVTSLAEYNNGLRSTIKGQDRLGEILLPVLVDSVESLVEENYEVDVYLILGFELREERLQLIQNRLPEGVGLQVWSDAPPLGYPDDKPKQVVAKNTRALSRQHRYVIKDKITEYELFMAFEDDMRITGAHVQHFLNMTAELDRLHANAPDTLEDVPENMDPQHQKFFGSMTKNQMKRLIPGFVRVEVLLNSTEHSAQTERDPIALDHDFFPLGERHFDPSVCCHALNQTRPSSQDVVVWETNISALSVRQLSGSSMLDWVILLPGPGKMLSPPDLIGGYWSGRDGAFGKMDKPSPGEPRLIAQQGGWMATREQIIFLNSEQCHGRFLPPFDEPMYTNDGHYRKNVEYWSGGYQFFTGVRGGCNMQRLVSFHPDHFSKHFIYHVANNKQKQLSQERLVRADDLMAQLNSVRKAAERTKASSTL